MSDTQRNIIKKDAEVTGLERFLRANMPEHPGAGESIGLMLDKSIREQDVKRGDFIMIKQSRIKECNKEDFLEFFKNLSEENKQKILEHKDGT